MPAWSSLWGRGAVSRFSGTVPRLLTQPVRHSGGHDRNFNIVPSRFQWEKFKDMFHFYFFVGAIPWAIVIFCSNIFVGPATLEPIPEGYTPKYWEYHRHPITRFIARYIQHNPQQDYEKYMHYLYEESEKIMMRKVEQKIKVLMSERQDYQSYYYRPAFAKYIREYKKIEDDLQNMYGEFND